MPDDCNPLTSPRWRPVPDAPPYHVSDSGEVFVEARVMVGPTGRVMRLAARLITQSVSPKGYLKINMRVGEKKINRLVHRLVLTAFVGPCPDGMLTRHLNGDPADNRLANLVWGTPSENNTDARNHGTIATGERSGTAVLSAREVHAMRTTYYSGRASAAELARAHNVAACTARDAIQRKTWTHWVPLVISNHDMGPADVARRRRRRVLRGVCAGRAKLSESDVYEVRALSERGWIQSRIAERFAIERTTVSDIVRRRTWAHLPAAGATLRTCEG